MRRRIRNPELLATLLLLRKQASKTKASIWRDLAERLAKPRGLRVAVNVSRINRHTTAGETVVVPGKVVGAGELDHPVRVVAFQFSKQAREKITKAKGSCLSFGELVETNPKGSGVRLIG